MAKVIGPLHSTEARGVVGGLIFNTWRGVRYVKRMTSPAQPRTSSVLNIRALAIRMVRAWQTLSATLQSDWRDYAAAHTLIDWTGVAKRITGANWYTGLNTRLASLGHATVDTVPIIAAPDSVANLVLTPGVAKIVATWTSPADIDLQVIFWMVGPHSKGLLPKIVQARMAFQVPANTATKDLIVTQVGRYTVWAIMMNKTNGLISVAVSGSADVASMA